MDELEGRPNQAKVEIVDFYQAGADFKRNLPFHTFKCVSQGIPD